MDNYSPSVTQAIKYIKPVPREQYGLHRIPRIPRANKCDKYDLVNKVVLEKMSTLLSPTPPAKRNNKMCRLSCH